MKLVKRGGFLLTCSCSHYMTPPLFEKMLRESAQHAGREARLLEARGQAPDHPILLAAEEDGVSEGVLFASELIHEKSSRISRQAAACEIP